MGGFKCSVFLELTRPGTIITERFYSTTLLSSTLELLRKSGRSAYVDHDHHLARHRVFQEQGLPQAKLVAVVDKGKIMQRHDQWEQYVGSPVILKPVHPASGLFTRMGTLLADGSVSDPRDSNHEYLVEEYIKPTLWGSESGKHAAALRIITASSA